MLGRFQRHTVIYSRGNDASGGTNFSLESKIEIYEIND